MTSTAELVLQLAQAQGLLSPETAASTPRFSASGSDPERVLATLIDSGRLDEADALALLAAEFSLPWLPAAKLQPEPEALATLPRELAREHGVLPLRRRGSVLVLAIADPLATEALAALAQRAGVSFELVLASAPAIRRALERSYFSTDVAGNLHVSAVASEGGDVAVIQLAERLLAQAVERRASDLHLEPASQHVAVRLRVDGALRDVERLPKELQRPLASRLKLMAGLSLAERRLPQDGRMEFSLGGRRVDLRVSCLPAVHGEAMVLRVLDRAALRPELGELGLAPGHLAQFERWLGRPDGLVLVCGPTGSGKTTTLYSCLQQLNEPGRKLVTVEDPVEYRLRGVNQVSVNETTGLTFAAAARAILRHAPNVVMIGEIRDRETADCAMQAALTGHLVLSTLHTEDATGAVVRLLDLGVPAFLVAAALRGVAAQRLVRRRCSKCADADAATECPICRGERFRGRLGLFELLECDAEIAALIQAGAGAGEIRAASRRKGGRSLREDGLAKVHAGATTLAEVLLETVEDAG